MFCTQHVRTVQNILIQLHPLLKRTATATLSNSLQQEKKCPSRSDHPGPFLATGQAYHHSEIKPSSISCIDATPHTLTQQKNTLIFPIFAPQIILIS